MILPLPLSGLKGNGWELSGVVMPTELGQSDERIREKIEVLKISALEGEECICPLHLSSHMMFVIRTSM